MLTPINGRNGYTRFSKTNSTDPLRIITVVVVRVFKKVHFEEGCSPLVSLFLCEDFRLERFLFDVLIQENTNMDHRK